MSKATTKKQAEESRGQRTSRTFRDAAGLPPRSSDSPKDLSDGPTELAEYTGPEGGYAGDESRNVSAINSAETAQPGSNEVPGPEVAANPEVDGQVYDDLKSAAKPAKKTSSSKDKS